ncbi:Methenyltetrahydromethanopterin cyclohydrolase [Frankliniella fusca]|uniref:Methenyltetrahydromethanopterin cyclohydrolase n=1 Tax=Frankliniella fusca TaxID=407009 RepID=A0AAE1HWL9_9NEOP|nr:Methenyltetrahydromethanopterin cyclohydrolase [Frankliniella fusca]
MPAVSPESVVIPIVSCILGFPLLALLVICCLRRRAKLARERARRGRPGIFVELCHTVCCSRNCDTGQGALSLVRLSAISRIGSERGSGSGSGRAVSLQRGERSLSRGFPSLDLELDTVVEERSSDPDPEVLQDLCSATSIDIES